MDNQVIPQVTSQPPEQALIGWGSIARLFNVNKRTIQSRRKDMKDAGILFDVRVRHNNCNVRQVAAFPSMLIKWVTLRGRL